MTDPKIPITITDPLVDRPKHYGGDEAMCMAEESGWGHGGCFFAAARYLYRIGLKDPDLVVQDAQKALWYVRRIITSGTEITGADVVNLGRFWEVGRHNLSDLQLAQATPIVDEIFFILGEELLRRNDGNDR